jgi:peptidoglycan/xylan/chitin deacetylase (PgdA/CDA1 family)
MTLFQAGMKALIPRQWLVRKLPLQAANSVLLTFDDGPHPEVTPEVLKRLEKYKARAIFFIPGRRIEKAPYLLKVIREQGHLIGNHTYIHSNESQPWFLEYWRDLVRCQKIIEQHEGERPSLFRPAGGRISFTTLTVPQLMGLRTVIWSLEAEDWRCRSIDEAREAGQQLIRKVTSGDIVLLHDDNPYVLNILDALLPSIQSYQYDLFSGIDCLLGKPT